MIEEHWVEQAACANIGGDMFFPDQGGNTSRPLSVCNRCPVIAECLTYALENDEQHGVWGGTTANDRRRIRSRR